MNDKVETVRPETETGGEKTDSPLLMNFGPLVSTNKQTNKQNYESVSV